MEQTRSYGQTQCHYRYTLADSGKNVRSNKKYVAGSKSDSTGFITAKGLFQSVMSQKLKNEGWMTMKMCNNLLKSLRSKITYQKTWDHLKNLMDLEGLYG